MKTPPYPSPSISFLPCELANRQAVNNASVKIKWENPHEVFTLGLAYASMSMWHDLLLLLLKCCWRRKAVEEYQGDPRKGRQEMTALPCIVFFLLLLPYVHSENGRRAGLMMWKTWGSPLALLIFINLWSVSPHSLRQCFFFFLAKRYFIQVYTHHHRCYIKMSPSFVLLPLSQGKPSEPQFPYI